MDWFIHYQQITIQAELRQTGTIAKFILQKAFYSWHTMLILQTFSFQGLAQLRIDKTVGLQLCLWWDLLVYEIWSKACRNVCMHTCLHAWSLSGMLSHPLDMVYKCFIPQLILLACTQPEIWPWAHKNNVCMHTNLCAQNWVSMLSYYLDMV